MTKLCKKCGSEFTPEKGLLNFCSMKCTKGREQTPEMSQKKREKMIPHWKEGGLFREYDWDTLNKNPEKIMSSLTSWYLKAERRILNGEILSTETTKKYLIEKHGHKCWQCEATEWQGKFLHLEMDHIDGDNKNNELSNVRILCPNCHSITPTWRYKNIKRKEITIRNIDGGRSGYIL
jgi:hypothetical protein